MPVRFYCCNCRQLLQISRRKIGSQVDCPRCKTRLVVPDAEPDEGETDSGTSTESPASSPKQKQPASQRPPGENKPTKPSQSGQPAKQPAPRPQPTAGDKPAAKPKSPAPAQPSASAQPEAAPGGGTATATAPAESQAPTETDEDLMAAVEDEGLIPEFIVFDEPFEATAGDSAKLDAETATVNGAVTPEVEKPPEPKAPEPPPATAEPKSKPAEPSAQQPSPAPAEKPKPAAEPPAAAAKEPEARTEARTETKPAPAAVAEPTAEPEGVYLSRRMVYVQAVLMLGLLFLGLATGYWAGRGDTQAVITEGPLQGVTSTFLDGRVVYQTEDGQFEGDAGSVVVAVPTDSWPDPKLPYLELRPGVALEQATIDAVKAAGGMVALADREGAFTLVVPKAGTYYVLVISQHTMRHPNVKLADKDRDQMEQFFSYPEQLISTNKYLWGQEEVESTGTTLRPHNFGLDGFK